MRRMSGAGNAGPGLRFGLTTMSNSALPTSILIQDTVVRRTSGMQTIGIYLSSNDGTPKGTLVFNNVVVQGGWNIPTSIEKPENKPFVIFTNCRWQDLTLTRGNFPIEFWTDPKTSNIHHAGGVRFTDSVVINGGSRYDLWCSGKTTTDGLYNMHGILYGSGMYYAGPTGSAYNMDLRRPAPEPDAAQRGDGLGRHRTDRGHHHAKLGRPPEMTATSGRPRRTTSATRPAGSRRTTGPLPHKSMASRRPAWPDRPKSSP